MPQYKKYHDIVIKDDKKVSKYLELASAKCMEHYSQTEIIPVIIGVMRTISKRLAAIINGIGIPSTNSSVQISVITSTSIILHVLLSL